MLCAAAFACFGPALAAEEPAGQPSPASPASAPNTPLGAPATPPAEPGASAPAEESAEHKSPPPRLYLLDRLAAGASVGYFSADKAQILSEMHFDFPFLVIRQKSIYVRGNLETVTVRSEGHRGTDSFQAQSLEYLTEGGVRDYLSNRVAIAAFFGLQGRRDLDGGTEPGESGTHAAQYLGLGFESAGFPRPGGPDRFEWRLAIGPVFETQGVEGDFFFRGAGTYDLLRSGRHAFALEATFDSLFDGTHGQTEYRVGPAYSIGLQNGVRASIFAHWIRGENPLLLEGEQGWNFGLRYTEGAYAGPHTMRLPDVRGVLGFGRGSDRGFGRFDVDLSSPEFTLFSQPARVFGNLDANSVGGSGPDTLYYIAQAGLEVEVLPRLLTGVRLYHRSNHSTGDDPVVPTSMNLIQGVAQTTGWDYSDRLPGRLYGNEAAHWYDRIEGSFVPGIVTGATFSEAQSWDIQGGLRFDVMSRSHPFVPFVRVFGEWGDVRLREASIGLTTPQNLVIDLRYRTDSQDFGELRRDIFLGVSLYF